MLGTGARRPFVRGSILAFVILIALGALSGCGEGSASSSASGGSATGTSTESSGTSTSSAEAPESLTIGSGQKILTLNSDLAADGYSEGIVHLIGGNLYERLAEGEIVPQLASSKKISANGLTWTFTLKPNLKFSDGSPLTSEDVKDTMEWSKADKENLYIGFVEPIAKVEAPNPTTVIFHLSRPYPSLPTVLSEPQMAIWPSKGLKEGPAFFNAPVSAGQYMVKSWGGSPTAVLTRNPNFAGDPPAVQTLTFQTIEDPNARFAQVQSGQLDFAISIPSKLLANPPAGLFAETTAHYGFVSMPTNVNEAPFDEVGVRQAISLAVNREQISQIAWNGEVEPIAGFWPSTSKYHSDTISTEQNLEAAEEALKGTACEGGCTVNLMYSSASPWAEPTATVVAQNLNEIGIDVKLEKEDDASYNERLVETQFQMALGFLYHYDDIPDGMLLYAMDAEGGLNADFTGFQPGPDIEKAVNAAITKGGQARMEAAAEIERLLQKYQPFITLSDYGVGSISRYPSNIVRDDAAVFIQVAREGS